MGDRSTHDVQDKGLEQRIGPGNPSPGPAAGPGHQYSLEGLCWTRSRYILPARLVIEA